ncbi:sodium/glucose cotransporter 1-like [Erinaceus europaeus]|uniref:Sodium/glucose cotransporter 1-like n=1 Tax=Erinaceus europaeus TaxID=9365 RepID=A0ABM3XIF7_ERIEU|nr:sodium/glucose cotransporter 1-like [Erinaceus europaeus]
MALVAVSITFLSVVHTRISEKLFEFMQVVSNYLAPPIAATFFLAIFSTRVTEQGAFWGLTCGLLIGFIRLMLELAYKPWSCSENSRCPVIICGVHYLYFTIFLFLISLLIIMIISTFTDPIPDKYLHRLCWSLRNSLEERVLLHTEILRRKSKPQVYSDIFLEERSCIWKIWSVFCGLELQETKCVIEVATKEKTDHDETKQKQIFEGIMFGDLILKDKSRRQERRKNSEKPSSSTWKNITSAIGIFLILVAVILHIFFL